MSAVGLGSLAGAASADRRKTVAATRPQVERSEPELINRVLDGEKQAFYELVRPYERTLFLTANAVLGNQADAEDVAQEAVLKAFTNLQKFRGESKFSTWLVQITVNEARMKLRRDRRKLYESIDKGIEDKEGDYVPRDFADWREIPSEALQRKELREALARALNSLKPMYREVLVLRDVEHLSIAETAKTLGISEASVKTRLVRARFHMRDALAPGIDGSWSTGRKDYKQVRPW